MILAKEIKEIAIDRFLSKYTWTETCWNWNGPFEKSGYGTYCQGGKRYKAHRVAYFLKHGSIDQKMVIDHICRNRKCVNPDHLRQVTHKVNNLENSLSLSVSNKNATHCPLGHEYNTENTYIHNGDRYCRACKRIKEANRRKRLRGEG